MTDLRGKLLQEDGVKTYMEHLASVLDRESRIVLFGAGNGGMRFWEWAESRLKQKTENIVCFLDNNASKWGTVFPQNGVEVKAPDSLSEWYNGEMVVITCGEGDVIRRQLGKIGRGGVKSDRILMPDISAIDTEGKDFCYIWDNIDAFEAVYGLLKDDKSKHVFHNLLNYKICHDISLIEEICDRPEEQYFDRMIPYDRDDVFLDCGGYIGDTVESYISHSRGVFGKVISLEADHHNYEYMCKKFAGDSRIKVIEAACWNRNGELHFDDIGSGSGNISENGKTIVQARTIDYLLAGEKVSFIKMDIEGAEYEALCGAHDTIKQYHPILQISVYHKQDDFIRLPLLIKSMWPGYQLFFRHYRSRSVQETVCYALPSFQRGGL